jgi:hypothetical protein
MNAPLVAVQIIRFDSATPGHRPHWQIAGYRPDCGTVGLYWLGADGWLPAYERADGRRRHFGTLAAARRVLAKL